MKNGNALIVRLLGKNMELSVFEDRVELYKAMWSTAYRAQYGTIHGIQFRLPSQLQTGFIKIRSQGAPIDFVTYKTGRRDSDEEIADMKNEIETALAQIESRTRAARGLPENAQLTMYF